MTNAPDTGFDVDYITEIENKLSAARTKLILDKPFLGALVLRLPLQAADPSWCMTTGTDARKFYYNPDYIRDLNPLETQFILAHEALHCALSHFSRRQHRIKHRWDLACDYAINPILVEEGLKAPPNAHVLREYVGMTAEEIYPCIDDNDHRETLDQHLYDKEDNPSEGGKESSENPLDNNAGNNGSQKSDQKPDDDTPPDSNQKPPEDQAPPDTEPETGNETQQEQGQGSERQKEVDESAGGTPPPPPLNQQEAEELTLQWQQRLAGAAQQAMQSGKFSGVMKRLVDNLLQPQLPWRSLLSRYMTAIARDDYSYTRPSTRRGDPAIFPTLKSSQIHTVVALDVSGSVGDKELREFLGEINAIKGQVRAKITLLLCDSELIEGCPLTFEPWEEATLPKSMKGGGTTSFKPVFNWANQLDQAPDILIYFTDAYGDFPDLAPTYPCIWLIKGKQPVPWGQRIQLN